MFTYRIVNLLLVAYQENPNLTEFLSSCLPVLKIRNKFQSKNIFKTYTNVNFEIQPD